MKTISSAATVLLLGMCRAQAQAQVDTQDAELQQWFGQEPTRFEKAIQPPPRLYGKNFGENPNDQAFKGMFKTDPKLLIGIDISPGWSLEAGYVNLFDRGFHRIDERDARDTAGALGIHGFRTHAAAKYSMPITDRLSAYGKFGIAYSRAAGPASGPGETGLYTGIGARLKVNDRVTIGVEYGSHGGGARNVGNASSSQVKADIGITF